MKITRPALYIVGTPIGNLEDLSPRAVFTLSNVDFIAAEDTRVTLKLLNKFEIKKELISYYEHNLRQRGEEIITRLKEGKCAALCSDAGMPAISDPGEDLVRLCAAEGIPVFNVPGPSAAITALASSGLSTGRFCFEGFLSTASKSRREHLKAIACETRTMIFYEAPHKLQNTLKDFIKTFGGERKISLCRELTKLHEQTLRFTLSEAAEYYEKTPPKGEFVLILEGAKEAAKEEQQEKKEISAAALAKDYENNLKAGHCKTTSLRLAAEKHGISRNAAYELLNK